MGAEAVFLRLFCDRWARGLDCEPGRAGPCGTGRRKRHRPVVNPPDLGGLEPRGTKPERHERATETVLLEQLSASSGCIRFSVKPLHVDS
jgi:hypothetical protein